MILAYIFALMIVLIFKWNHQRPCHRLHAPARGLHATSPNSEYSHDEPKQMNERNEVKKKYSTITACIYPTINYINKWTRGHFSHFHFFFSKENEMTKETERKVLCKTTQNI